MGRRGAIAALVVLGAACARAPVPSVASAPARAPATAAATSPERPARYGAEVEADPTALEASTLDAVRGRLARGGEAPRVSGALVLAARELARRAAAGDPDPLARGPLRAALARVLSYDPAPVAHYARGRPEDVAAALAGALAAAPAATHVGAGAVEKDGVAHVVLLASARKATLQPFPRDVAVGASAELAGEIAEGLRHPRVFVTLPPGGVREAAVSGTRGFRARIEFPVRGRYLVEVMADGPGGPEVAALLAVSAGGAPLDVPGAAPALEREDPDDVAATEAAIVRAVNATRRRHGAAPVTAAPELSAVARRHAAAMRDTGRAAHVVAGSGVLGDRLQRAGIRYRRAFENVALARTSAAAHAEIEGSPAHLANVLRPEVTRLGVGVARGRRPTGDPVVYLTEIFVEPPDDGAASRLTPPARVREALWAERARSGRPPLTADAALDDLAREAAERMRARDATDPEDLGSRALALGRGVAAVDVFVGTGPQDAVRSVNLPDARFRRVGVGVSEGDSRRFGAGRLFIAVVYTD